jgi:hypothetical protein
MNEPFTTPQIPELIISYPLGLCFPKPRHCELKLTGHSLLLRTNENGDHPRSCEPLFP